ncbi:MAG: RluA family pseudouridine synthase [Polyangiales bacterium]
MIPVLYEDAGLVAVDKPAGVVVIPARDEDPGESLRAKLEAQRGERLWVVHRVDRDTSGVVLFARSADAHRALNAHFEHRRVDKRYLALTRGVPSRTGDIDLALHPARKGKMRPALPGEEGSVAARTTLTVLREWATPVGPVCLVEAKPHTGRQHQIRVHLRALDAPLVVDPLYGRASTVTAAELGLDPSHPGLSRLSLHAAALSLPWPAGETLTVSAPLASDLSSLIDALSSSSSPS